MKKRSRKNVETKLPDGWKFSIATSIKEIEAIRPIWEKMQDKESSPAINADIDRYISVVEAMKETVQPYVMILFHNDNPTAMIVARIEKLRLKIKLGYKVLFSPELKCLIVVYGGILGEPNSNVCSYIIRGLLEQLQSRKVNMVYFNRLKTNSDICTLSRKLPGILSKGYFPEIENHFSMSVPENLDQFYKARSHKHRARLKRYVRKLEKEYPNNIKMVTYRQEVDLDKAIKAVSQISHSTYQYGLGYGFTDDYKTRCLLTTAAKQGWLRIYILYSGQEPCAFQIWLQYKKVYIGHGKGFDPKWSKWRIGTILFIKAIERLCADPTVEVIDFGFGEAEYKKSYSDKEWQEASVYIFALRFYPICVNILRTFIAVVNSSSKHIADTLGLKNRIKRLWRNQLEKKNSENEY